MSSPAITQRVTSSRPIPSREHLSPEKESLCVSVANEPQQQQQRVPRPEESSVPVGTQSDTAPVVEQTTAHEYNDFFQRLRTELTLRGASSVSSPPPCALLC